MAEVETDTLLDLVNQLTGETPVEVDGEASLIESRAYDAGDGLEMATQFAYAFLEEQGLDVRYQEWEACDIEGRNVIGEGARNIRRIAMQQRPQAVTDRHPHRPEPASLPKTCAEGRASLRIHYDLAEDEICHQGPDDPWR